MYIPELHLFLRYILKSILYKIDCWNNISCHSPKILVPHKHCFDICRAQGDALQCFVPGHITNGMKTNVKGRHWPIFLSRETKRLQA